MSMKLTQGCIAAIMRGEQLERPVVQLLNYKRISSTGNQDRYRIIISDGIYYNSFAMLATQLNDKIINGELPEFTIISLDQYIPSNLPSGKTNSSRKVLVILNLTILMSGHNVGTKIGNPKMYDENCDNPNPSLSPTNASSIVNDNRPIVKPSPSFSSNSSEMPNNIVPIVALNPYQNKWTIKARIVSKSPIRSWSNARGEGKLFSMDLLDESGSIRGTAFTDICDKYFDMMELNKVYYISRCSVKPANKKFTSIPHDFELTFTNDTSVIPCMDGDASIPQIQYSFTPLSALKDIASDSLVDILGICKNANEIQNLVARTTRRDLKKRDITLVDQTDASVTVSLWGTTAEQFDGSSMPVVAIKSGRLTEFQGGKTVSIGNGTTLQINPDIPKAHQLRGWFDSLSEQHQFSNVSNKVGSDAASKVLLLKEVSLHQLGTHDKTDYFNCEATVMFVPNSRALYEACPSERCNKKIIDMNNGSYRCEKCNQEYPNFKYRLLLKPQISDWTGTQYVSVFQESAEQLLGATAEEIGQSREAYKGNFDSYFRKPLFKTFHFRIAARMDTFNNETRLNMSIISLKPIDFKESCKRLMNDIMRLSGVSVGRN